MRAQRTRHRQPSTSAIQTPSSSPNAHGPVLATFPFGDDEPSPVLNALVASGRVLALTGHIGGAGEQQRYTGSGVFAAGPNS